MCDVSGHPKKGERYIIRVGFKANVLTTWCAPFTGGGERFLPAGLEFIVDYDPPEIATAVSALPNPYELWEKDLVSPEDRKAKKYSGYYLVVPFDRLLSNCERL